MNRDGLDYSKPSVQEVFTDKKYKIPKYQRPFAWDAEKALQFYDDIFAKQSVDDYFLGSILLNKNKENGQLEVIDGQQRLTTISIFLLALYLVYRQNVNQTDAEKYIHRYIKTGELNGEYSVLQLSRHNDAFYQKIVDIKVVADLEQLALQAKESNANILKVLYLFIEKINQNKLLDTDREKARLSVMLDYLLKKVFFIQLTVADYSQASKLFEVLNNRGTELSEADIIRNYILSEIEKFDEESEVDTKVWESIEEKVSLKNLEKFLRYCSFSLAEGPDIYSRIKKYIDIKSPKSALTLLADFADTYSLLDDPENTDRQKESELLTELNIIGITQTRSVLIAAYSKYNTDQVLTVLNFLIAFSLRFVVSGKNPNKLEKKCAELSFKVFNGLLSPEELIANFKDPDILPAPEEFKATFLNKMYKTSSIPRYMLSKIENTISSGEKNISNEGVHLEHIMPKKGDKWFAAGLSDEIHKKYVNNIGNMVILSKTINTQIKNSLFSIKKASYDDSEISLVTVIKNQTDWGEREIKLNAERYLQQAELIWFL